MAYDNGSVEVASAVCGRCGGETSRRVVERVDDFIYLPLFRRTRVRSTCSRCKFTAYLAPTPSERIVLPKAAGLIPRMVGTYVVLLLGLAAFVAHTTHTRHVERRHALSPLVGDRWVVSTKRFPTLFHDDPMYGVLRVAKVESDHLDLLVCNWVSDDPDMASSKCRGTDFGLIKTMLRAEIPALVADGAFFDVDREGTPITFYVIVWNAWCALLALGAFVGWRYRTRDHVVASV